MNIAFLSTRRSKPSFRFRIEQALPYFEQRGHACRVEFLPRTAWARLLLYRRLADCDAVVLQKRLLHPFELKSLRSRVPCLIYDLDDAVMFDESGRPDRRRTNRFRTTTALADLVICGNRYLARQAEAFARRIALVPTPIDTDVFHPGLRSRDATPIRGPVTIGWTGSSGTNRYLGHLFPILSRFAGRIRLKLLSDSVRDLDFDSLRDVDYEFVPWSPEVEAAEVATFGIGVMPLPDNPWTRGKCGFKALQYMALGIPTICSRVGVNREIIQNEETGLLAVSPRSWERGLERLITRPEERDRLGAAGRRRIETDFALAVLGPKMVEAVEGAVPAANRSA